MINRYFMKTKLILSCLIIFAVSVLQAQNPSKGKNHVEKKENQSSSASIVKDIPTVILSDCGLEVRKNDESGSYKWDQAKAACQSIGDGWRMPDKVELDCLYKNREKIGGFQRDWYLSSDRVGQFNVWVQSFMNGKQFGYSAANPVKLRCVRSLKQ